MYLAIQPNPRLRSIACASSFQCDNVEVALVPLLILCLLHPGIYEIYRVKSWEMLANTKLLPLFETFGLAFELEEKHTCLTVYHSKAQCLGHYQFCLSDYPKQAIMLLVLSAFIRGRVWLTDLVSLDAATQQSLAQLLPALKRLGAVVLPSYQDGTLVALTLRGTVSYQGGLVFEDIEDSLVAMALMLISTRCRQGNYLQGSVLREQAIADFLIELQRLGVHCEWVTQALQIQPYWLSA